MRTNIMTSLVRIIGSVVLISTFYACMAIHPSVANSDTTAANQVQSEKTITIHQRTTTVTPRQQFHKVYSPTYFGGPSNADRVFVGGTPIMTFRIGAGGFTPEQRAAATQERLNNLLGEGPISPDDITVQPQGNQALVMVKGQLLFTADPQTAAINQMTPMQLAEHWADNMRGVLPSLTRPK